jgi:RNA polymerase sigma factor (sigma-70 family)
MNFSIDDKLRIRQQFDCFCKKVLRFEVCTIRRKRAIQAAREVAFSDLTEGQISGLQTVDEYPSDMTVYKIFNFAVEVRNDTIAAALDRLPIKKRNVILLVFFWGMSNKEIAKLYGNDRGTIYHHKITALRLLKNILKGGNHHDTQIPAATGL